MEAASGEPPAAAPLDPAVERRTAEWALSVGAKLFVQIAAAKSVEITRADQLPPLPFTVNTIEIRNNPRVNDQSLAVLRGLSRIDRLDLTGDAVTDRGMDEVRTLTTLTTLGVSDTTVGDAGVEQIADLPRLRIFYGNNTAIGDRGAQSLARSKSLSMVFLLRTHISDAGLAHLARLPLSGLNLEYTSVSNAGVQPLQKCSTLTQLFLSATRVTDAGLGILAGMPALRMLELRRDNITDRGVEKLAALKSLQKLAITDTQITQAGYETLQTALPGCKIDWSQGAASNVAATTPTNIAPLSTLNRLPVPSSADQQKALATLKDVFKDDFAAAKKAEDKVTLAEKLLKQAQETGDDAAAMFALIGEARVLAADAADAGLSVRLVSDLGSRFQVDPLELLADDLEKSAQKSHPSSAFKAIADVALEHLDEALEADAFPLAKRLSDVALAAARKAKDSATLKTAIDRNKGLATLKQQWDAAQGAQATLAKTPDDPEANLALGRYLCFTKGDWAEGFAHLARGSDATLKDLAAKSVANPQDAAGQAELGEAWAQAADAAKGRSKADLQAGGALLVHPGGSGLNGTGQGQGRAATQATWFDDWNRWIGGFARPRQPTLRRECHGSTRPGSQSGRMGARFAGQGRHHGSLAARAKDD